MLNFDNQQSQQQQPIQTQQQQLPESSNLQTQAQEPAQVHIPQNYQVQGQQIIPASDPKM